MSSAIASSSAVDLSLLPPPAVVEALDYEAILADLRADYIGRYPEYDAVLESDPIAKLLELVAYRELILRQRVNDGGRAVLVAYATGADLDNIAAIFGVARKTIVPADPQIGTTAIFEDDSELRRRVLLAPDSYSVAGPQAAYIFHALSASPDVLDASAISPAPGQVIVSIFSREGNGQASPELLALIDEALSADTVRPLTDEVTVRSVELVPFDIDARLTLYPGPDAAMILAAANAALNALLTAQRSIGRDITRSALFAALHVGGVQSVEMVSPAADIVIDDTQVAAIGARDVAIAGYAV